MTDTRGGRYHVQRNGEVLWEDTYTYADSCIYPKWGATIKAGRKARELGVELAEGDILVIDSQTFENKVYVRRYRVPVNHFVAEDDRWLLVHDTAFEFPGKVGTPIDVDSDEVVMHLLEYEVTKYGWNSMQRRAKACGVWVYPSGQVFRPRGERSGPVGKLSRMMALPIGPQQNVEALAGYVQTAPADDVDEDPPPPRRGAPYDRVADSDGSLH